MKGWWRLSWFKQNKKGTGVDEPAYEIILHNLLKCISNECYEIIM